MSSQVIDCPEYRIIDAIRNSQEGSLEKILSNDLIKSHAKTNNGDLSDAQHRLVATTVSLMQDQAIETLENNIDILREELQLNRNMFIGLAERTAGLRAQIAGLYMTPFLTWSKQQSGLEPSENEHKNKKKKKSLIHFLSWGNVLAIVAAILFGVAVYYTKAYASYKDRVGVQDQVIQDLKTDISSLEQDRDDMIKKYDNAQAQMLEEKQRADIETGRNAVLTVKHNELEKQYEEVIKASGAETVLKDQLEQTRKDLKEAISKIDGLQGDVVNLTSDLTKEEGKSGDYERRWNQERQKAERYLRSLQAMQRKNDKLQQQLAD